MPVVDFRPHILQVLYRESPIFDKFGGQTSEGTGKWVSIGECFCHDNSQGKQYSERGELQTYQFQIAYNGKRLEIGTHIRCLNKSGDIVCEGDVRRVSSNYCEGFRHRQEVWI